MAYFHQVPLYDVNITGGFWAYRQKLNREVTLKAVRDRFLETGRFSATDGKWREGMPNKPHIFFDSDIAKWMEAVAYDWEKAPLPEFETLMEETIDNLERQQTPDGYVNSYFNFVEPTKRWYERSWHELYCAGHFIEAAVAWKHATGRDRFEKIMCRYADHIYKVFVEEKSAAFATPGHEEIELALVKLYHSTGNPKYLELSRNFIDLRGNNDIDKTGESWDAYASQSHLPVRRMTTAEGHSVRAGYLYSAMADLAREYDEPELKAACEKIFDNIYTRRMYITGGVGSTMHNEAYTADFDLPNQTAYTETCAAISLALFANRMLRLSPESRYADAVETVMYNGFLSSTSLDGRCFYYSNPMEILASRRHEHPASRGFDWLPETQRVEVFGCSCCPPNINRFVSALGEYMLTDNEDTVYLHQFFDAEAKVGGASLKVTTNYPVDGVIRVCAEGLNGKKLGVRIPGWCEHFDLTVPYTMEKGYAMISGENADFTLTLDMPARLVEADSRVWDCTGKAALQRGPVVYCLEGKDNPAPLRTVAIGADAVFACEPNDTYIFPVITANGKAFEPGDGRLYRSLCGKMKPIRLTFIPYYAFANRGEDDMRVWIPVR